MINQADKWKSKDNWEFIENGSFISIRNISNNEMLRMVLTVDIDTLEIKEELFVEDFQPQQWIKGNPDANGFFILKHALTSKLLTNSSPELFKLNGNLKFYEM